MKPINVLVHERVQRLELLGQDSQAFEVVDSRAGRDQQVLAGLHRHVTKAG